MSEYNHRVVRRLFRMAAPYKLWFLLAGISLILTTGAELSLPVILQKTIDRNIISDWYRLDASLPEASSAGESSSADFCQIGDSLFIRSSALPPEEPVNTEEAWYLFPWKDSFTLVLADAGVIPEISSDRMTGAVKKADLALLDRETLRIMRSADLGGLRHNSLLYFALLTVVLFFSFIQIYTMSWTSQGVMKDLRLTMLSHVMNQSLSFLGDTPVGQLVSRITSDVETINEFFTSVVISLLKDIAIMAGVLITLFLLDPGLAGFTILTLPPVLIMTGIFRRLARNAYRSQRHWIGKVNAFLSEHITGMEIIQIFGQEKRARKDFDSDNGSLLKASLSEMYVFAVFRPLVDLFTSVSLGVVIYLGAGLYGKGSLTLGILIAFIDLIQKFYRPVMDMSEKFTIMQSAMAGGERMFQLLDEDNSLSDRGRKALPDRIRGRLEFRDVSFAYKNDETVLNNLSFTARPGETIAIVGYTGAGKTTVASLAARLWDIQAGVILLDDQNITEYSLKSLRNTIQTVQQDVFLFSGTIAENIALGSDISRENIMAAAKRVQADSFIQELEKGYDSPVQERGANLSAGQRQLLSFARVLAHDPDVIILDEATASIDSETEKLVQQALDTLLKGRTSLVIAHRISTIQKADKILVLSLGELVEQGTHEELLERKDLYYSLYRLQYESRD